MRTFTFRFIHGSRRVVRDVTIASTDEAEAKAAAWGELVKLERRSDPLADLPAWRLASIRIAPAERASA